jgi:peptide deformylase
MALEIKKYPDPILKSKVEEVREITRETQDLARQMVRVMVDNDGIGLAGPQVGAQKRIIVVVTEKGPEVFINPKVVARGKGTELMEEGCLSVPGLFLKIKRSKSVEVEALTLDGEKIRIKAEGLLARIFQHEIDHLDGILFTDRVSLRQKLWRFFNG